MRAALGLLTILPVGHIDDAPGRRALCAFPLVGVVIGMVWVGVASGVAPWGGLVAAAAVVAADAVVTGGLHLDGVADIGDMLGSRRWGADALAVARDPHVGALGVVALVSVLLVRFTLVALLLTGTSPVAGVDPSGLWPLLAVPMVGRTAMVAALAWSPRGEGSSTASLTAVAGPFVLAASLMMAAIVLFTVGSGGVRTAVVLAAAIGVSAAATTWWRRRVGEASGDLVGAVGVLAEITALAVLA